MAIYFPTEAVGIGLPMPGLTTKLVPDGERYEVRLRGPMITPGYLGNAEANRGIFDDEGFYRTGDTAQFHDPDDVGKGLKFAGRLAEQFKLATGTWVSGGKLREALLEALSPLVSDLLVCGENLDYLAVLVWPKPREGVADLPTELAARFRREQAIVEQLVSPYLAPFVGAGVLDDGRPYFAVRAFAGITLEEHLRQGPIAAARLNERYQQAIRARLPIIYEHELPLPTGPRVYNTAIIPMLDDTGRVQRLASVARDVTTQRLTERLSRQLETQLAEAQNLVAFVDAEVVDVGVELDGVAHLGDGPVEVLLAHEDAGEVAAGRERAVLDAVASRGLGLAAGRRVRIAGRRELEGDVGGRVACPGPRRRC